MVRFDNGAALRRFAAVAGGTASAVDASESERLREQAVSEETSK
jgi:hypothetical protein